MYVKYISGIAIIISQSDIVVDWVFLHVGSRGTNYPLKLYIATKLWIATYCFLYNIAIDHNAVRTTPTSEPTQIDLLAKQEL